MENQQLQLAYNFVQYTNRNIFLTGKAGTGKTTFLHNLKKTSLKRMAVVAPTGVAAINAGGVTIHSFFQLPFGPYIPDSKANPERHKKFNREKINLIQSLDLLVIDEISMVRADTLDGIDEVLRRYKDYTQPFGGLQVLMIGDLHQLSPVVKDEDWKILREYYDTFFFFGSRALQKTSPVSIELKHIYRQSDETFISLLNHIRENRISAEILNKLNQRYIPEFKPADEEGYITLTTHNNAAKQINQIKLNELKSSEYIFNAIIKDDFPEYSYPTVAELEVKVDAQIMFVKNDPSKEKLFYNGKIGRVVKITRDAIFVKCPADDFEIEVRPAEWQNIQYVLNSKTREIDEHVIGSFIQYPLKLAWAITIHKSQGLTFAKAIIDANAAFAHGQVYVALSRCKTFNGIVLSTPITISSIKTDGSIAEYTKLAEQNPPGEQHLTESKIAFQQALLFELFNFNTIKIKFFHCIKIAEDSDRSLPAALIEELNAIKAQAEKDVYEVAEIFKKQLGQMLTENSLPEENGQLQERIKKASTYFTQTLQTAIYQALPKINIETDNKAIKKSITDALLNLRKEVFLKLAGLKQCNGGFNTNVYLKVKADAEIDFNLAQNTQHTKTEAPTNIPHPRLYAQLRNWRNTLANEANVPVYIILPQKALNQLVELLPGSLKELEAIKGIGKVKIKQYGNDILAILSAYCEGENMERQPMQISIPEEKIKIDTKKLSLDMFRSGKTTEQIAAERGLTRSTIEGHLAHYISTGEVDLHSLVPQVKADKIISYMLVNKPASLADSKMALGDEVSYGELRAVVNYLEFVNPAISE